MLFSGVLSFKMRTQQTNQRGKTEIAIHPIENNPIAAVAETSLMPPSYGVELYSIALFALATTKEYAIIGLINCRTQQSGG